MITVKDVDSIITAAAPRTLSESWDNDGIMLCADDHMPVKKILIMLEVTHAGAEYAAEHGYDLIVTHHPLIFKPLSRLTGDTFCLFGKLMRAGISVLSYHTRMDSAEGGVNDCAAELLKLVDVRSFGGENGCIGRVGNLPESVEPEAFAACLKTVFHCPGIRASFFRTPEKRIRRVALVGGAGKDFYGDAYAVGADAFVTAEVAHHIFAACKRLDMCLFDCGHYYTENPVCMHFSNILVEAFGRDVTVDLYDVGNSYLDV